jgi:hypothetical protein
VVEGVEEGEIRFILLLQIELQDFSLFDGQIRVSLRIAYAYTMCIFHQTTETIYIYINLLIIIIIIINVTRGIIRSYVGGV